MICTREHLGEIHEGFFWDLRVLFSRECLWCRLCRSRSQSWLFPHAKDVSCCEECYEAVARWEYYLQEASFSPIIPPESRTDYHRHDKSKPYHKCCLYTRVSWYRTDNTSETDDDECSRDEFTNHQYSHTFAHFFHFFFGWSLVSMMDPHPLFSEKYREPQSSENKIPDAYHTDREPVERVHMRKIKNKHEYYIFCKGSRKKIICTILSISVYSKIVYGFLDCKVHILLYVI